jgi:hypothetical protein
MTIYKDYSRNVLHIKSPFSYSKECNLKKNIEAKITPSIIMWRPN